jgi:Flp pilus assembly pilin Flp
MFGVCSKEIKRFHRGEDGDIVQTAIIIGVLALIAIAVLTPLRGALQQGFNNIRQAIVEGTQAQ